MHHWFCCFVVCATALGSTRVQDIVANRMADNQALIISVSAGLPGLKQDRDKMRTIMERREFGFQIYEIWDKDVTKPVLDSTLTHLSRKAGEHGTLFVYFGGHGAEGHFYLGDESFYSARDFKKSIARGREGLPPLERLLVFVDACESGTFVDPWKRKQDFIRAFGDWAPLHGAFNLFLFASSEGHETSMAAEEGSYFTTALKNAFDEAIVTDATLGQWAKRTQELTEEHHPVAKFVPQEFAQEKVLNSPCLNCR